jgi:hypothetical protein
MKEKSRDQAMIARWPSWAPRGEYLFIDQMAYVAPLMHIGRFSAK